MLPGVRIFEPTVYEDKRGSFLELWSQPQFEELGLPADFVQDNLSISKKGVLRGLHYQYPKSQGKLVTVLDGAVYDVIVDLRRESERFGRWFGIELSATNRRQLYIPAGMAHGFVVLSDSASFYYKCTENYAPQFEHSIRWNDPDLAIEWPVEDPVLSPRDEAAPRLREIEEQDLPT